MPTATDPRTVPHGRATRSSSRSRSVQPPESAAKSRPSTQRAKAPKTSGKSKAKAKEDLSTVPELTDSEDDKVALAVLAPRQAQSKSQPRVNAVASGSGTSTAEKENRAVGEAAQRDRDEDEDDESDLEGYDPEFASKPFPFDDAFLATPRVKVQNAQAGPSRIAPAPASIPPAAATPSVPGTSQNVPSPTPKLPAAALNIAALTVPAPIPPAVATAIATTAVDGGGTTPTAPAPAGDAGGQTVPRAAAHPGGCGTCAHCVRSRAPTAEALALATAQVIEVIPHADRSLLARLLEQNFATLGERTVPLVIERLLEGPNQNANANANPPVPAVAPPPVAALPVPAPVPAPAPHAPPAAIAPPVPIPVAVAAPLPDPAVPAPPPIVAVPPAVHPPLALPVAAPIAEDPLAAAVAQIVEVIPDIDRTYLRRSLAANQEKFGARTAEVVLGALLENGVWPRVNAGAVGIPGAAGPAAGAMQEKGKGRERDVDVNVNGAGPAVKRVRIDYASADRPHDGTGRYTDLALIALQCSFPYAPKNHLRTLLIANRGHYAPTHLQLRARAATGQLGYRPKMTPFRAAAGERELIISKNADPAFAVEFEWVRTREALGPGAADAEVEEAAEAGERAVDALELPALVVEPEDVAATARGKGKGRALPDVEEDTEDGMEIECQCCFGDYPFAKMVQCPEAHLFCGDCLSTYAATQLGQHTPALLCMHASGCGLPFPASELGRVLSPKLMALYERLTQAEAIKEAGLEGLEECPFCEWKCVWEPDGEETRFWCANKETCGVVSCRLCKKKDHLPKTCEQAEADKHLDGRHAIEEAMTRALMRNCPKCKKAFIKEAGCNKMTCPNCHTLSCYVCRVAITGYEHFDQNNPSVPRTSSTATGKCLLFDNVEERHAADVRAAAEAATAEYRAANPDADEEQIKVDVPVAPAPAPALVAAPAAIAAPRPRMVPEVPAGWGLPNVHAPNPAGLPAAAHGNWAANLAAAQRAREAAALAEHIARRAAAAERNRAAQRARAQAKRDAKELQARIRAQNAAQARAEAEGRAAQELLRAQQAHQQAAARQAQVAAIQRERERAEAIERARGKALDKARRRAGRNKGGVGN